MGTSDWMGICWTCRTDRVLGRIGAILYNGEDSGVGKKKQSPTEWMLETVCNAEPLWSPDLPVEFVCGLRASLEAGLSCEEITALLILFIGVYEASERYTGDELIRRATTIANVMRGDVDDVARLRERRAAQREARRVRFE